MTAPSAQDLRRLVDALADRPVLVVGDLMLDQFVIGRVNRISPEAPVPVVEFDREEFKLGGAANVAHTVKALGGTVRLVGTAGDDEPGRRLRTELARLDIDLAGILVDPDRRTTTKLRVVTARNQQVARVDYETDRDLDGPTERQLIERVESMLGEVEAVVVSDYLKGVITGALMQRLVAHAGDRGTPVLVDPKIPHVDLYAGATIVTPNHVEAEAATHMRIRSSEDARRAARVFRRRSGCASVLLTRGEHGMWLLEGEAILGASDDSQGILAEEQLPAVTREVADVTGAGDTVIGTIALALAAGASQRAAARLANHAAGVAVGKFGPVPVTRAELLTALEATPAAESDR
jgi:D-beta-D-heptose 7-phosphate kinase/D-beta-D-heptose 1-phosphate adenosyltransferase